MIKFKFKKISSFNSTKIIKIKFKLINFENKKGLDVEYMEGRSVKKWVGPLLKEKFTRLIIKVCLIVMVKSIFIILNN